MSNQDRRNKRCERRKIKRLSKKKKFLKTIHKFVINSLILYENYKKSRKGISWKTSIQKYGKNLLTKIDKLLYKINNNIFDFPKLKTFTINERGKLRNIKQCSVDEKILQKIIGDDYLIPYLSYYLIYDNGATLKGKGTSFARKRLKKHLFQYYKEFHTNKGYVLKLDFKSYFASINHTILKEKLSKIIQDEKLMYLISFFLDKFKDEENKGLALGSQMSQILAVWYASDIDYLVKSKHSMKYYGRYMDDSYIISNSKTKLIEILKDIEKVCVKLDLKINYNKTKIIKLERGFNFLKGKFILKESGKILHIGGRECVKRERNKLRKMKQKYDNNLLSLNEIYDNYNSWKGFMLSTFDNKSIVNGTDKLYSELFI